MSHASCFSSVTCRLFLSFCRCRVFLHCGSASFPVVSPLLLPLLSSRIRQCVCLFFLRWFLCLFISDIFAVYPIQQFLVREGFMIQLNPDHVSPYDHVYRTFAVTNFCRGEFKVQMIFSRCLPKRVIRKNFDLDCVRNWFDGKVWSYHPCILEKKVLLRPRKLYSNDRLCKYALRGFQFFREGQSVNVQNVLRYPTNMSSGGMRRGIKLPRLKRLSDWPVTPRFWETISL